MSTSGYVYVKIDNQNMIPCVCECVLYAHDYSLLFRLRVSPFPVLFDQLFSVNSTSQLTRTYLYDRFITAGSIESYFIGIGVCF